MFEPPIQRMILIFLRDVATVGVEEKEGGGHADGDEAAARDEHHLHLRETMRCVTARIGEDERDRQQNIHREHDGVKYFPRCSDDQNREHNEEDEDIVFAGRALRGVLFMGGDLVLQFP